MLIVTNTEGFPKTWTTANGTRVTSQHARSRQEFLQASTQPETIWLVNCDPRLTYELGLVSLLMPWRARPIVALDLVLAPMPPGPSLWLRRLLLKQISHFIHLFKDWKGYAMYGVTSERSSFVPFKANLLGRYDLQPNPEGEYILCFGRSRRDFDTFFAAMEQVSYPGAIMSPDPEKLRAHGARFTRPLDRLPPNVRVLEDDGTEATQLKALQQARIVALPTVKDHIAASGLSVCLNAMILGKCVVGSEGPGMSDLFTGKALIVPHEDPEALAAKLREAWESDSLRRETAQAGYEYALSLGDANAFHKRVVERIAELRF